MDFQQYFFSHFEVSNHTKEETDVVTEDESIVLVSVMQVISWNKEWTMIFVLFSDICVAILFLSLQITKADTRPQVKWAVNLVIADSHFLVFLKGFEWVRMG